MARAGLLFVVAATALGAFVVRSAVVVITRRRWPGVAAAVDRWWPWAPLAAICLLVIWRAPFIGIPATAVLIAVLLLTDVPGWPLRPRR